MQETKTKKIMILSHPTKQFFSTPLTAPHHASLSLTISWSSPKFMSIESVMQSNHLILCHPLLCLPSVFPSIRVFSNESAVCTGYCQSIGASVSVLSKGIHSRFPLGLTGLFSLLSKGLSKVFSNTTVQKHQFFSSLPSLWSSSHIHIWLLERP